jgi:hypothetical protein
MKELMAVFQKIFGKDHEQKIKVINTKGLIVKKAIALYCKAINDIQRLPSINSTEDDKEESS